MAPTMGPERRLHPASFLFAMGAHLKSLLVPGVAVVFTAGSSGRDWEIWLTALLVPYALAAVVRSLSFRYRFDSDEMVVRRGWIFRSERHIPYARIQNIDAVQNVFHRLLHVAEVRVETASGGEAEATMTVLPVGALDEMRRFVFAGRSGQASEPASAEVPAAEDPAEVLLHLSVRDVLLYGVIESRGAVVMAGAFGLLWEFGLFDRVVELTTGDEVQTRSVVRHMARMAFGDAGVSALLILQAFGGLIVLLIVLRILSMAWAFVRLHGFTLRRAGQDLRVEYGLLTRINGTIPLQRIQTLTVSESPLHRLFARRSVHVDTAGGTGNEVQPTRREPIAPLIRLERLDGLLRELLPTVALREVDWQAPHPRAWRRALVRTSVFSTILLVILGMFVRGWALAAAPPLAAWAWIYARRYVAHLGWAYAGDAVVFRRGWLWRRVTVARFSKIQAVAKRETPFDRRLGMASVAADTAGSTDGRSVDIPFLAADTATMLAATLHEQAARTAFRW
jgi:putative membrane protein